MELDFLVNETFNFNNQKGRELPLNDAPGVLFTCEESDYYTKFFCSESSNIKNDFDRFKSSHSEQVYFFETSSFFEAKLLSRQYNNFKFFSENYQKLAGVSLNRSWVVSLVNNIVTLTYEMFKPVKFNEQIELGPIGDLSIAEHYLSELRKHFISGEKSFDKMAYKSDRIILSFKDSSNAESFYKQFVKFDFNFEKRPKKDAEQEAWKDIEMLSVKSYFQELKTFQHFWSNFLNDLAKNIS